MCCRQWPGLRLANILLITLSLYACGGGGGGGGSTTPLDGAASPGPQTQVDPGTPVTSPEPPPAPAPPWEPVSPDADEASRFLSQATFGPTRQSIDALTRSDLEAWFLDELDKPASLILPTVLDSFGDNGEIRDAQGKLLDGLETLPSDLHWQTVIEADDQLRQRMAYALSQILVVSFKSELNQNPQQVAHYIDILSDGAFGNYRDLLEAVVYSPAMATYLTYMRNRRAHLPSGRVPDENFAREILQLFTVGLVELNRDGTPVVDGQGRQRELYDNTDITELAKVFTGLSIAGYAYNVPLPEIDPAAFAQPLAMFDQFHAPESKRFLGTTIPAGTPGDETIDMALDAIVGHPNVGPFIGRQLIQRFVTSAPRPAYVARVAGAFDAGSYVLPSGRIVGNGRRGDLRAVLAAVLFDVDARDRDAAERNRRFGKLREPVLRFTHWARAFEVNSADAARREVLRDTSGAESLGQHAFRSPSVFNFYNPGYVAPGTATGEAGLTAPELQITTASAVVSYPNFMSYFALGLDAYMEDDGGPRTFQPDYSAQSALAHDPEALLDHLDTLLTYGGLRSDSRARIVEALNLLPAQTDTDLLLRAQLASLMVMTTPEYLVQR